MKKGFFAVLVIILMVFSFGCKSDGESRIANDPNIPEFVANPPIAEDAIFGVGSAKMANPSTSMQAADARARTDIATKLNTQVQAMVIDYSRVAGTESNPSAALSFYQSVSRQLTEAKLQGIELVKREQTADGTYWTLMRISKTAAASSASEIIESEASRYAEFKAMDALKMMEDQLNKSE
jgi:hypothetical protein